MRKRLNREQKRLVKFALDSSLTNGRLNPRKVSAWAQALSANMPNEAFLLLMEYRKLVSMQREKEVAYIFSATLLTYNEQSMILKTLQEKEPKIQTASYVQNASLLGGLRIKIGDVYWDSSLAAKLALIKG